MGDAILHEPHAAHARVVRAIHVFRTERQRHIVCTRGAVEVIIMRNTILMFVLGIGMAAVLPACPLGGGGAPAGDDDEEEARAPTQLQEQDPQQAKLPLG
jgi:hypothetical protein